MWYIIIILLLISIYQTSTISYFETINCSVQFFHVDLRNALVIGSKNVLHFNPEKK